MNHGCYLRLFFVINYKITKNCAIYWSRNISVPSGGSSPVSRYTTKSLKKFALFWSRNYMCAPSDVFSPYKKIIQYFLWRKTTFPWDILFKHHRDFFVFRISAIPGPLSFKFSISTLFSFYTLCENVQLKIVKTKLGLTIRHIPLYSTGD